MTKKGSINITALLLYFLIISLVVTGLGYVVGYTFNAYNSSTSEYVLPNTTLTNFSSLDNFIDATQLADNLTTANSSVQNNYTAVDFSASDFFRLPVNTFNLIADLVALTPLGEFKGTLYNTIVYLGLALLSILTFQWLFNRSLTS